MIENERMMVMRQIKRRQQQVQIQTQEEEDGEV